MWYCRKWNTFDYNQSSTTNSLRNLWHSSLIRYRFLSIKCLCRHQLYVFEKDLRQSVTNEDVLVLSIMCAPFCIKLCSFHLGRGTVHWCSSN